MDIKMIDLDKADTQVPPTFTSTSITPTKKKFPFLTILVFVAVGVGGFYSGAWLKAKRAGNIVPAALSGIQSDVPQTGVKVGDIFGSADETAFKDPAVGVLEKGGFKGEGTHQLVRTGGASQTVYLTSSTIDLDLLVGNQVTIWGQTFKGIKVGWLMDVGRAKVEALNAQLPN